MKVQWRKITRVKYCPLDYEKIQLFYATVYSNRSISIFKLRLSPSKKIVFVCFNKSPFKMMKNVFLFLVKSPFLSGDIYIFYLEIFTFFIWRYLHFFIWRYLQFLSGDIYIFYLEIFTLSSWFFGYVEKRLKKKAIINFKIYDVADWTTNDYNTHTAQQLQK